MSSSKLETLCRRQRCQQGLLEYHIQLEDARLRTPVRRLQGWKWKCCNSTATSTHSDKPKQTSRIVKSCRQNKQKDSLLSFTQTQQCIYTTLTLSASGLSFRRGKIMLRLLSDPRICALSKPPRMNYNTSKICHSNCMQLSNYHTFHFPLRWIFEKVIQICQLKNLPLSGNAHKVAVEKCPDSEAG